MSETAPSPVDGHSLVGQLVDGKYRIAKELGRGGMGAVYSATHLGTDRTVALKVITPKLTAHPEAVERFRREAKAAGQLRHPNVVNVTDFGFWESGSGRLAYLVMEYLDGFSLGNVLKEEKSLPIGWIIDVLEQVCVAVQKAHSCGIIHRDLKPDNIWLEPNDLGGYTVKVLDFGIARLDPTQTEIAENVSTMRLPSSPTDDADTGETLSIGTTSSSEESSRPGLTVAGRILGTPHYMSPEQCMGAPLDHRTDIYSLGVIAFEMLTAQRPFGGKSTADLIDKHLNAEVPAPHKVRSSIPRGLGKLVESALAKRPEDRPSSAAAFASALRARSEGLGPILRRALVLYTEHFGALLLISGLAFIPTILSTVVSAMLPASLAGGFIVIPLQFIAFLLTFAASIGLIVPIVANLLVRPLSPIRIHSAVRKLLERLRPFTSATVRFYVRLMSVPFLLVGPLAFIRGLIVGDHTEAGSRHADAAEPSTSTSEASNAGSALGAALARGEGFGALPWIPILAGIAVLVLLIAVLVAGLRSLRLVVDSLLYGPAVIMEDLTGREALARSRRIARNIRKSLFAWVALLAVWIGFLGVLDYQLIHSATERLSGVALASYLTVRLAASILIYPLIIVSLALLYFKARQTEGDTLGDIIKSYEKRLPLKEYRRSFEIPSHYSSGPPRSL